VKEAQRTDARLSKLQFTVDKDFRAGQRVKDKGYTRGINEGQPFVDPWKNPYLMRGIPSCQVRVAIAHPLSHEMEFTEDML
jgi:hypothetical protein